jgi:RNA polymerase sigma-70 factor, ECF subfamily
MPDRLPSPRTPAEADGLHARVLAGDRMAFHDLVETRLPALVAQLRRRWPTTPRESCEDAAIEALFNHYRAPERYDPARSRLDSYLFFSAHRDLQNALEREERQRSPGARSLDRVALGPDGRKETIGGRIADPTSDPAERPGGLEPALLAAIAAALPEVRDRRIFDLMAEGERDTTIFAAILGIEDLAPAEQRGAVKRAKDRIRVRVRRHLERQRHE